jgi:hypothetical protein
MLTGIKHINRQQPPPRTSRHDPSPTSTVIATNTPLQLFRHQRHRNSQTTAQCPLCWEKAGHWRRGRA